MHDTKIKKHQKVELTIVSLAFGGQGVARINDYVVFVRDALPGQRVQALITRTKKSYAEARVIQVLSESPFAVQPRCSHFKNCGGCLLQHLRYDEQIKAKSAQVADILRRIGGLDKFELFPTRPAENIFYYRNKMEFSFSRHRWLTQEEIDSGRKIEPQTHVLGLHARGFYDKVVDIKECHLVNPVAAEICAAVRTFAQQSNEPVYSTSDHAGFWRFLVVRPSIGTSDLMVNIVTSRFDPHIAEQLKTKLMSEFPALTSLINGISTSKANVAFSEHEYLLAGKPTITEKLGPYSFVISANSFFQTNTHQANRLYDIALECAEFHGNELVYDLYCGAGTISIFMSPHVKRVIGFESVEAAVSNARENCQLNSITNCHFVLGDLKDVLNRTSAVVSEYGQPDVVVVDPPRGGMHPRTVKDVLALKPKRIVHVSCNPATLARELAAFCETDYRLTKVQPVDMFPHTAHIEVVAQLVRQNS
ncbi:23S rRNA (uracil(1939)-C(5))-methyltransferase RlmD [candidate division KSB1 bacterium]|nr:23S rRNA (uracil(1939)-C(5))-methyltransferase RlmD [candidate division KSB1 bacterium]RQW00605.1 MAG: 23S rRNA (uracil(1939)-C(5))-methyltransferase RlmD [candidate division KSB1 bacterium]